MSLVCIDKTGMTLNKGIPISIVRTKKTITVAFVLLTWNLMTQLTIGVRARAKM